MKLNKIIDYAQSQGYEGVEFLKKWRGYSCYEPYISDELTFTGLPLVILVKGEDIRMSTPEEALQI